MNKKTSSKKQNTLLKAEQFNKVFETPSHKISNKNILLLAGNSENQQSRLGLVVAKKKIPLAVNRNRFKRLAREHFRENIKNITHLDIIILSRADISTLSKKEQNQTFQSIFSELKKTKNVSL